MNPILRLLFVALASLCAGAGCGDPEEPAPWLTQTVEVGGVFPAKAHTVVRLSDGGGIHLSIGGEWKKCTLAVLGRRLEKAWRKSTERNHTTVECVVSARTPWRHLCRVLIVCREWWVTRVRIAVGKTRTVLTLPLESTALTPPVPFDRRMEAEVSVSSDLPGRWGSDTIREPVHLTYAISGEWADKLLAARGRSLAGRAFVCRLRVDDRIAAARVLDFLATLAQAGCRHFGDFTAAYIPPLPMRQLARLPYPSADAATQLVERGRNANHDPFG